MKKIFVVALVTIFTGIMFSGCEKENNLIKNTNSKLLSNETFQNMVQKMDALSFYVNSDNILVFKDDKTFAKTLDILQTFSNEILKEDTSLTYYDIAKAFEEHYGFYSLNSKIEEEALALEKQSNLTDKNDPDNHFIVGDYLRTVITPNCEVIIGELHYVFRNGFSIGIMNNDKDTRKELLSKISSNCDIDDYYYFCNEHVNAFIISDRSLSPKADFTFHSTSNPLEYSFTNASSNEDYLNIHYLWDFGDGCTSNQKNPIHEYTSSSERTITLKTIYNGEIQIISKKINVGQKSVTFTYNHNGEGVYYFTASADINDNDQILYYNWNFGDSSDTTIANTSSNSKSVKHKFSIYDYSYHVTLTIQTVNGETYSCSQEIKTPMFRVCKTNTSIHSGTEDFPHQHLIDNQYIKTSIGVLNTAIIHNISTKTVFKEKKPNNTYKRIKAKSISTGPQGKCYLSKIPADNTCGNEQFYSLTKNNNDAAAVNWSTTLWGLNNTIAVDYHSIGTYYYVKNYDEISTCGIGVVLHNKQ